MPSPFSASYAPVQRSHSGGCSGILGCTLILSYGIYLAIIAGNLAGCITALSAGSLGLIGSGAGTALSVKRYIASREQQNMSIFPLPPTQVIPRKEPLPPPDSPTSSTDESSLHQTIEGRLPPFIHRIKRQKNPDLFRWHSKVLQQDIELLEQHIASQNGGFHKHYMFTLKEEESSYYISEKRKEPLLENPLLKVAHLDECVTCQCLERAQHLFLFSNGCCVSQNMGAILVARKRPVLSDGRPSRPLVANWFLETEDDKKALLQTTSWVAELISTRLGLTNFLVVIHCNMTSAHTAIYIRKWGYLSWNTEEWKTISQGLEEILLTDLPR